MSARIAHRWPAPLALGLAVEPLALAFAALAGFDDGGDARAPEDEVRRWVRAARGGDPEAARRLYRAHVAKVYRTVRPLCRDDAEAEDVTQETFARALEALDRYEARPEARFRSWLLAIGVNVARRSLRRHRRTEATAPDVLDGAREEAGPDDPTGEALDRRRLAAALLAALDALEDREREVVTLRYGGELNAREIADLTGLSHANVRKIAQRARDALRARIDGAMTPSRSPRPEAP